MTPSPQQVRADARRALDEDVGSGDLTAHLIPAAKACRASVVCREAAVIAGRPWFDAVFAELDTTVRVEWGVEDGRRVEPGSILCELAGPARSLFTGERTALNFLQLLSGTATRTAEYAEALRGTRCQLLDTRKTLPGLRLAQKYAVRCGGGSNHRLGLFDAILIKENHIAACGGIASAIRYAREIDSGVAVEIEVEDFAGLEDALAAGADVVMLDNFSVADTAEAVARAAGRARLEASGNVDWVTLGALAETGVDYISVGALTKHVQAVDLSMRFLPD